MNPLGRSLLYRGLLLFAVLFLLAGVLLPLGSVLTTAFFPEGRFSFASVEAALGSWRVWVLLGRTLLLGALTAAVAAFVGVTYAWLLFRTNLPGAALWRALGIAPIVMPALVISIAWSGMLPRLEGMWANVFLFTLAYTPIVILLAGRAFEQLDPERLDAARLAGGERSALRVALALARPQIAIGMLLVFVFTTNDFVVPDYITAMQAVERQQRSFNVYASEIFSYLKVGSHSKGAAASLPIAAATFLVLALIVRQIRRVEVTTVGSAWRPARPIRLGLWTVPALAFVLSYVGLALVAPVVRFVVEMQHPNPLLRAIGLSPDASPDQNLAPAFLQSLALSAGGATLAILASLAIAHTSARGGRTWSANLLWIVPLAFPGIAYGLGMVEFYSTKIAVFQPIRNGPVALLINLAGRFLPFAFFAIQGAALRTDRQLEEAALLSGARPGTGFLRITLPLIWRGLLGGWLLCFLFAMREVDSFTLLSYGESTIMRRLYEAIHRGRSPEIAAGCLVLIFFITVPLALNALLSRRRVEVL